MIAPLFAALAAAGGLADEKSVAGDATIAATVDGDELRITTTSRLAGAIHSLVWRGKEFIDSADHGRQLQSASNFDAGMTLDAETFNPTEAGSRSDGAGPKTTSRLLSLKAAGNSLATESLMAFWLAPEEKSGEMPAKNKTRLSAHGLRKRVTIGLPGLPHAIEYKVTFAVPAGEGHRRGVFEAVTGYMPAEFSKFWKFDPKTAKFEPLDDGPGEQSLPVALATPDGKFAMGVYSPAQPSRGFESAGYGRFRFPAEKVVKWNCVFREENPRGLAAKDYEYVCYVAVGTLEDVRRTLEALSKRPAKRKNEER